MGSSIKFGLLGFAIGASIVALQASRAAEPALQAAIAPGEWQLKEIGGTDVRMVCAANPGALVQVRQRDPSCSQFVLDSAGRSLIVHYTCGGRGHGRSILTVRSARSVKLETQGVATGAPFAADYDGKFVGPCGA